MLVLLKYYCTPFILTLSAAGYFSPFFVPLPAGGLPRLLVGNVIAYSILLFMASVCLAWIVAGAQAIMGIVDYRRGSPFWQHHVISASWTYACCGIVIALLSNGYYLTA